MNMNNNNNGYFKYSSLLWMSFESCVLCILFSPSLNSRRVCNKMPTLTP